MSITNVEIIGDALRELGVISEIQTPSAEQGAHALRKLNQMMAEWKDVKVDLGYYAQDTMSDTCPIPEYAENGVLTQLALRLAPNYGAQVPPELAIAANTGWTVIFSRMVNQNTNEVNRYNRPRGSGNTWGSNILTDA
jgi:hypothetical protein